MSVYSLNVSNISRGKMQSAVAHFAYISGEEVENEKTGEKLKYKRQDKVLAKDNILPQDAPVRFKENAANWINDIEQFEKADNARIAKKVMIALPNELDEQQRIIALTDWIKENCTKHGYPAAYAIHSSKDGNNPHAHIVIANRPLVNGKWQKSKSKTEYKLDKDGNKIPLLDENGKQKVIVQKDGRVRPQWQREIKKENRSRFDKTSVLYEMRESWSRCCNKHLDKFHEIDHRSYKDQNIMQVPTIHEGYAARALESKGGKSWKCQYNRDVKALNGQYNEALWAENQLEENLEKIEQLKGKNEKVGKASVKTSNIQNNVKSTMKTGAGIIKSAPGKLAEAVMGTDDEGGADKAVADVMGQAVQAVMRADPGGAIAAVGALPLAVAANTECNEVKIEKLKRKQQKAELEEAKNALGSKKDRIERVRTRGGR